jgi:hypothetical protein
MRSVVKLLRDTALEALQPSWLFFSVQTYSRNRTTLKRLVRLPSRFSSTSRQAVAARAWRIFATNQWFRHPFWVEGGPCQASGEVAPIPLIIVWRPPNHRISTRSCRSLKDLVPTIRCYSETTDDTRTTQQHNWQLQNAPEHLLPAYSLIWILLR